MTSPAQTAAGPAPTAGSHRLALLSAASAAVALAAADTYVVVLALTDMMAGVGIGIDALQRATPIISGFLLGYIAVLPLIGRLSDLLDRRRILLGCLLVFVVGSAVTALAVEMPVLVTGRVLQGIGGGGLVPATLALVADLWPPHRRGTPLGVVGAVQELGSVLGPVVGAVVLAWSGWRAIFWLNVAAALVLYAVIHLLGARGLPSGAGSEPARPRRSRAVSAVAGGLTVLGLGITGLALAAPDSLVTDVALGAPFVPFAGSSRVLTPIGVVGLGVLLVVAVLTAPRWWAVLRRADLVGAGLVAVALGSLVLTFASSDPEKEVVGPLGYSLLPVGAIALVALAWWHRRAADPLIPRGVVGARGLRALGVSLLVGAALVAVVVDVPLLARLTDTYDETGAALVLVRFLLAVPVGALVGGWSLRRLGDGAVAGVGLLLAGGGMLVMSNWTLDSVGRTVPSTVVLVVVDVPLLARLTDTYDETGAALVLVRFLLAVPVGALVGGWSLRRLGDGAVAGVGLLLAGGGMLVMSSWTLDSVGRTVPATVVLVVVGLGMGLALAPVNNAALADSPAHAHGVASSLVVVARMVGMVVGLALLTSIGLARYFEAVRRLPDQLDTDALVGAGVVQVQTVFLGGAIAALAGAVVAFTLGVTGRASEPQPEDADAPRFVAL